MWLLGLTTLATSLTLANAAVSWTATPLNPPSYPLAVRSPYLSAWLPQGAGAALNDVWPTFWTGQIIGWAGLATVDGKGYSFLGAPAISGATFTKAVQKSSSYTATQSVFVLSAGPVDLTVRFLSPVEPLDLVKQSIPFSYMAVSAKSTDGKAHSVKIYSDISAEWVSGDNGLIANWTTTTGDILTHQVQLAKQTTFAEINDHTQYGSAYYSVKNSAGTTYQTGGDAALRAQFINNGKLSNTLDTNFRAINNNWPVFAFAQDFGSVTESQPVVFSVGHIRDPVISYITANAVLQKRSLYFWSKFSSAAAVISSFLSDYSAALSRANSFDAKLVADSNNISSDYAAITTLSIRQAFAAIEITISKDNSGAYNANDILVFMKEISSNGNMNTVDVIFPAWPIYLYTNPALGKYLLEGLFRYQATGQYPNKWSIHDLGAHYPNATAHNDGNDEAMPVEESGNMIIMSLSYLQKTGDRSQINQYISLLEQWTEFLISDSLIPAHQISTDDFAGPLANQTNLAIKGLIGIAAMGEIENILGNASKASNYKSIAANYVTQWQKLAMASTGNHLTLSYGNSASWGLVYNLYADKLLKLNLFPASIYQMQTAWYKTVAQQYGVPLDTRHSYTKSDWEIWTATVMTDIAGRDLFIGSVKNWLASGKSDAPFGDWYETTDGRSDGFRARPVAGGHLAFVRCMLIGSAPTLTPRSLLCRHVCLSADVISTLNLILNGNKIDRRSYLPNLETASIYIERRTQQPPIQSFLSFSMSIFVRPDSPPPRAPSPEFTLASLPCPPPPRRVHSQPKIRVHSPASLHPPTKRLHGARSYDVIKHRQAADSDDGHAAHSPTTASSSPIPSLYDSSTKRSVSVAPSSSSSTPRTGSPPPAQSSASSFVFPISKHFTVDQPVHPVPVTIPTLKSKPSKASLPPLERPKNMGVACLRFFGVRFPSTKSPRPPTAAV